MGVPPPRPSKTLASKLVDELSLFTENPRVGFPETEHPANRVARILRGREAEAILI